MKELHFICNAHLDPVWLWNWEEGIAAALSTFRSAVGFCEKYDTFVFNHNEALLYRWVEEYEPETFERIRRQIERGRWKVVGGWYLQPDCNMPCGEAFVRQIRAGNRYFAEKFGIKEFESAASFDSASHSRGLVQIMNKCGYKNYIITRPARADLPEYFRWQGYCDSELHVSKSDSYNSPLGGVGSLIERELPKKKAEVTVILWGVGNHGGGPSRKDIETIDAFIRSDSGFRAKQSDADTFFREARRKNKDVPVFREHLGTMFPGIYTTQIRIKQNYRKLETDLFTTEKMLSAAQMNGILPAEENASLKAALDDMLFCQFHDILPGSSIPCVEETALGRLAHGQEEASRVRAQIMFALLRDEAPAAEGEYPLFVFNPHPYPLHTVIDTELMLADQNWENSSTYFTVKGGGGNMPVQVEKEACNLNLDWRKRVVFETTLPPMQLARFDLAAERGEKRNYRPVGVDGNYIFENQYYRAELDTATGLIKSFVCGGKQMLRAPIRFAVTRDSEDTWVTRPPQFDELQEVVGEFSMIGGQDPSFDGTEVKLPPVHIIEQGDVRIIAETSLAFEDSKIGVRYIFYRNFPWFDIELDVHWRRKNGCLKMVCDVFDGDPVGETAYGYEPLRKDGSEQVAQRWIAMRGEDAVFAVLNRGNYGLSCTGNRLSQSILRSPVYSGLSLGDLPVLVQDRIMPRTDNGLRSFTFRVLGGGPELMNRLTRLGAEYQAVPFALQAFPCGGGAGQKQPPLVLQGESVELTGFYRSDALGGWVVRLYNGSDAENTARLVICGNTVPVSFRAMEVKNLVVTAEGKIREYDELL